MNDIQQAELSLQEAKRLVGLKEQALRLSQNKDFQDLILNGYFVDEAARLTHLLGDAALPDHQSYVLQDLHGIASFKRYMSKIVQLGVIAENEITVVEQTLDELRSEGI